MLDDHQWQLADPETDGGIIFGTADTGIQTITAPDLGAREPRTQDREMPREDGTAFGVDYEQGTTITFECNVMTSGWAEQSDLLDQFRAAWSKAEFRKNHAAYAVLKSCAAGRMRRAYGRPRRFAETDGNLTHDGYTAVVCDFATRDGLFYDEQPKITSIPIAEPPSIGFTTPIYVTGVDPNTIAFQTDTLEPDQQPGVVTVDGSPTWAWIEVQGPVTNPRVGLGSLVLELDTHIPEGDSVILDPRPWSRGIRRVSDGASLAGRLTWETPPMGEWLLQPGSYELTYSGFDITGTSTALVRWREAHHRP